MSRIVFAPFNPSPALANRWVQTFLAAARLGFKRRHPLTDRAIDLTLEAKGVRIHTSLSEQYAKSPRGLVILIHGWEGNIDAPYMIRTGQALHDAGYHVARLHLRDHGPTHHWNEGIFNGSMLEEHFEAVRQIAARFPGLSVHIGGYSLGGNFALRIASLNSRVKKKIPGLSDVFAVSAPLDPHRSTAAMDKHGFLGQYLLKQWWYSLLKKEQLFPERFDFSALKKEKSLITLTEKLLLAHSEFSSLEEYFGTYTLSNSFFRSIKIPCVLFTAKDDPIIPPEEYEAIQPRNDLLVEIVEHGGHVGFLKNLKFQFWYVDVILQWIESNEKPASLKRRGTIFKVKASKKRVQSRVRKVRK